ncbi:UDP-N-acetylmuramate dehydrogenase [bacterium 3DAC]|nr:UDP-N-acetylmuramate dehydrogenase [Dictyoglomota bacterium]UZN23014.1 UDP-N-acetylmuramate dehydrogenase [bacterium 3DAC]
MKVDTQLAEDISLAEHENLNIEMWGALSKYTTFKIGGKAKYIVKTENRLQFIEAVRLFSSHDIPFYILGGASNVLIDDKDWNGGVIITKTPPTDFKYENGIVEVFAGDYLPALIHKLASWDLGGFEFLVGVPGTVGGAIIMNAGTSTKGICDYVEKIEVIGKDGKLYLINNKELEWGYRHCNLPVEGYIVRAWLKVVDKSATEVLGFVREHMAWRREHQPIDMPCAGSFFKNPENTAAGYLIDMAGLKGYRVGDAQVSTKHANFIVNLGNATASDVLAVVSHVKKVVEDKFGIVLEEEVKYISHDR